MTTLRNYLSQKDIDNKVVLLKDINLSSETYNNLKKLGYTHLVEVYLDYKEISLEKNINPKIVNELRLKMKEYLGV